MICFDLPNERIREIPSKLRRILLLKDFKTKTAHG